MKRIIKGAVAALCSAVLVLFCACGNLPENLFDALTLRHYELSWLEPPPDVYDVDARIDSGHVYDAYVSDYDGFEEYIQSVFGELQERGYYICRLKEVYTEGELLSTQIYELYSPVFMAYATG